MRKIVIVSMAVGALALAGCRDEPEQDAQQSAEVQDELDPDSTTNTDAVIEADDGAADEKAKK